MLFDYLPSSLEHELYKKVSPCLLLFGACHTEAFTYFPSINMSVSTRMWWTLTLFYLHSILRYCSIMINQKLFYRFTLEMLQDYFLKKGEISQIIVYGSICPHFIVVTCFTVVCWPLVVSCSLPEYIVKGNEVTIQNLTVI